MKHSPPQHSSSSDTAATVIASIGNSLHVLNLLNIAFYGWALYRYAVHEHHHQQQQEQQHQRSKIVDVVVSFDEEWLESGFCMPHDHRHHHNYDGDRDNNSHYQTTTTTTTTTHDLSGHLMISVSLLGLFIIHKLRPSPSSKPSESSSTKTTTTTTNNNNGRRLRTAHRLAFWALIGAIGHGFGHYLISHARLHGYYPPATDTFIGDLRRTESWSMVVCKALPGLPLFWVPLTKTYMMNTTSKTSVGLIACIFWAGSLFGQVRFGFSYAQAVLFGGSSIDQLLLPRNEKDLFEFALWPLLTTVPNGLLAWYESTRCTSPSSPLMQQHGHLIYDGYMVSSYIGFYLICWLIRTWRSLDIIFPSPYKTNYGLSSTNKTRGTDCQMMTMDKKLS